MSKETQNIEAANTAIKGLVDEHLKNPPSIALYRQKRDAVDLSIKSSISGIATTPFPIEYLSKLISGLEERADLRLGVIRTKAENSVAFIGSPSGSKASSIIRDARLQEELKSDPYLLQNEIVTQPNDVPESWMINAAATTRGIIKLIELSASPGDEKEQLISEAIKNFQLCHTSLSQDNSNSTTRNMQVDTMNYNMKQLLVKGVRGDGVVVNGKNLQSLNEKEFAKMIVNVRDSASFETADHPSMITITGDLNPPKGVHHIESFVPVDPLSSSLKEMYKDLENQTWYKSLGPVDQALVAEYKDKISDGKHIIPTQLQHLPGVHNYAVSSTFFADGKGGAAELHSNVMRSASPAHNIGKKIKEDKALTQDITNENIRHIEDIAALSGKTAMFRTVTNEMGSEKAMGKAVRKAPRAGAYLGGDLSNESEIDDMKKASLSITLSNKDDNLVEISESVKKSRLERFLIHIGCKSGKDRTGVIAKHNNLSAICDRVEDKVVDVKKAYLTYNNAWGNENWAGGNGGSLGCYGLKSSSSFLGMSKKNILYNVKNETVSNKIANLNAFSLPDEKKTLKEKAMVLWSAIRPKKSDNYSVTPLVRNLTKEGKGGVNI